MWSDHEAGIETTTLCCSKRFLQANNKAVKVSWLKGTFYESRGGVPKNEEAYGMHFGKFLWFRKNKADPFVNLIRDISRVYAVCLINKFFLCFILH